ncbi:MAG: hypothetical protein AB7U40_05760 [Methanobacteriales archaeon]
MRIEHSEAQHFKIVVKVANPGGLLKTKKEYSTAQYNRVFSWLQSIK